MKARLEQSRQSNNWEYFSLQAMKMKILAAEKVEITDKGLEISMPEKKEPLIDKIPPMPEQRKF